MNKLTKMWQGITRVFLIVLFASTSVNVVMANNGQSHKYSPAVRSVIKLGERGGDLSPTASRFSEVDNQSFTKAMKAWNAHEWEKGVALFDKHIKENPNSPWAAESELHKGCYYRYTNQLTEAKMQFSRVIEKYPNTAVAHKAKKRLGGTYYLEGNYQKALDTYKDLIADKTVDWRNLTYAMHWRRHLSRIVRTTKKTPDRITQLNQCGLKSLALVYEQMDLSERAAAMEDLASQSTEESTFEQLLNIIQKDFANASVIQTDAKGLKSLKLPVIVYLQSHHYVVVTRVTNNDLTIRDPYKGEYQQSLTDFFTEWNGEVLVQEKQVGQQALSSELLSSIRGGCCGNPIPEPGLGDNPNQPTDRPDQSEGSGDSGGGSGGRRQW